MIQSKTIRRLIALLAAATLLLAGCTSFADTYFDYDGSGYFVSEDGYLQIEYRDGLQQLSSVDKAVLGADWKKQQVNIQVGHLAKDSESIKENEISSLAGFIGLYQETDLANVLKYATVGKLQDYTFEGFTAAQGYDLDINKSGDKVGARIYYLEDESSYYVIYLNGEKEHFKKNFELLDEMAHTLKVLK